VSSLEALWLRARAWLLGAVLGILAVAGLVFGVRRWGAGQRAAGATEGATAAKVEGLERAREHDATTAAAEFELDAVTDAEELEVLREADRRADGPLTHEDVEDLRRRADVRRRRARGGGR